MGICSSNSGVYLGTLFDNQPHILLYESERTFLHTHINRRLALQISNTHM